MDAKYDYSYDYSNRFVSLFSSKNSKTTILITLILICWIPQCYWSICPSSTSISSVITSEQCTTIYKLKITIIRTFTGYTNTYAYSIASGPVSNSLYYLYYIQNASILKAYKEYITTITLYFIISIPQIPTYIK